MKILVMKFRNIGDVLLTTPLIKNLRLYFPTATIDFALNKGCEAMIEGNPDITKIHKYQRDGRSFKKVSSEYEFINQIKQEKYDLAIQTTTGDRGILIAKYANIKQILSFENKKKWINALITHKVKKSKNATHMVEQNLELLKGLDLKPLVYKVKITSDEKSISHLQLPENFIHFHLTSRWMFKCVNDKTMAELIDFCQKELKIAVAITADKCKEEIQKVRSVISLCKTIPFTFAGVLNLKQVTALNKKSKIFIGVDTAIMHISAANNTPVIAFFGPSDAKEWGPWDNDSKEKYINKNGFQQMGKHTVIQKIWKCVPCEQDGCNHTKKSDCLDCILSNEIEVVKNLIQNKLKEQKI